MAESSPRGLTEAEIEQFVRDGFAGPFTLCSPEEMAPIREAIENEVLQSDPPVAPTRNKDRHLDCPVVYDLASHEELTSRISSIYGPDLLLFATSLFVKEPGYPEFPWHNDFEYWPMLPVVGITAWVALTEATPENGCVELLKGSHTKTIPHEVFGHDRLSRLRERMGKRIIKGQRAVPRYVDPADAVPMPVKPGQFFIFTERTVHRAGPNNTNARRMGLAVRITVPSVRIGHDQIFPGHEAIVVRGEDRFGFNRIGTPPVAGAVAQPTGT